MNRIAGQFVALLLWLAVFAGRPEAMGQAIGVPADDANAARPPQRGDAAMAPGVVILPAGGMGGYFAGIVTSPSKMVVYPWRTNVIDRAHFTAADLLMQREEPDEAIQELKEIVQKSPDEDAVTCAHISMGNILKTAKKDPDAALAEHKQAKGALLNYAGDAIAEIFREKKAPADGAAVLEAMLPQTQNARAIALLLVTISRLYEEAGNRPQAIAILKKGQKLIEEHARRDPRFPFEAQIGETLRDMAQLKEEGKDNEAGKLISDLYAPWQRRIREARLQREGPGDARGGRGADSKKNVPPEGEIEIPKRPEPAQEP